MELHPKLEELLLSAAERDASDLFLIPGEPPAQRLRGKVERLDETPLTAEEIEEIAAVAIGRDELAKIGAEVGDRQRTFRLATGHNVRVCVSSVSGNYSVVTQIMLNRILSVEQTGIPEAILEAAMRPSGLIVVSGVVGSGMQTSAYSLVEYLNINRGGHICTIEDPCVILFEPKKALIQQREVGVDVADARAGFRVAWHQDLDILFVNKLTSLDEIEGCIAVAETGHLVIVTLHGASTPQDAITRLIEVFSPERRPLIAKPLSKVLIGVMAQVLLPKKEKGRVAAYGTLIPDQEMREAIAEQRDVFTRKNPLPEGCQSLPDHIEKLRADGVITEEAARKALRGL